MLEGASNALQAAIRRVVRRIVSLMKQGDTPMYIKSLIKPIAALADKCTCGHGGMQPVLA
jgi:hypothetical protein